MSKGTVLGSHNLCEQFSLMHNFSLDNQSREEGPYVHFFFSFFLGKSLDNLKLADTLVTCGGDLGL
jgi:hypothetical protein